MTRRHHRGGVRLMRADRFELDRHLFTGSIVTVPADDDPDDDRHLDPAPRLAPGAIRAELRARTYGEALRPPRSRHDGGEFDPYRRLSTRTKRRLVAAGFIRKEGLAPDQLARLMDDTRNADEVCEWFLAMAVAALDEDRAPYPMAQRDRYARRHGHRTYFELRDAAARAAGFRSFWQQRCTIEQPMELAA